MLYGFETEWAKFPSLPHFHGVKNGGNKMENRKQELSAMKLEQLNKQPIIETSTQLSEDKKWVVHKTTITDIKPVSYLQKVLG